MAFNNLLLVFIVLGIATLSCTSIATANANTLNENSRLRHNSQQQRRGKVRHNNKQIPVNDDPTKFKHAPIAWNIPPKVIPGQGIDFVIKGKGIERNDHVGTEVKRHTPYAELYLLCPTNSCLRERRTLISAKDPVETKFVGLSDYECFNAKEGTVSLPYHPRKQDHGDAPAGLHRWSCLSKENCKNIYTTWIEQTGEETLCDKLLKQLNDELHRETKLDPFESWFIGDLGVSEHKVANHSDAVQAYEDAVLHQKNACLKKSHWEHVAGPLLSIEAYADAAHIKANNAEKVLSAAKERLNNAQMGKLGKGEQWYISRGMNVEGLEKMIHRALAAKKVADARWGKFEMQAEKADVAGPGIFRNLRHARRECNAARNATRDALLVKDQALETLRKAEGTMLEKMKIKIQPLLDKIKKTETQCTGFSKKAEAAHSAYHRCRLGDPKYTRYLKNATSKDMFDDESPMVKKGEEKSKAEAEKENVDASGPEGEKEKKGRKIFEGGEDITGGSTGVTGGIGKKQDSKLMSLFKNQEPHLDLISEGKELQENGMDQTFESIDETTKKETKKFTNLPDKATTYQKHPTLL